MKNPPMIKDVRVVAPCTVALDWSTGETLQANLVAWLKPPFDALRDEAVLASVTVDDWGHGLNWPNGLDMGADNLYELCREQAELPTAILS